MPRPCPRPTDCVHLAPWIQTLALSVHSLWLWAAEQTNDPASLLFGGFNSSSGLMLVGHSRGAKVNSIAAAWFPQDVRGIVNIDPVDSSPPFHRISPDYPSALPLIRGLSTPSLNVGSQLGNQSRLFGMACAPQGDEPPRQSKSARPFSVAQPQTPTLEQSLFRYTKPMEPPPKRQGANYEAFFDASNRAWMLDILRSGHMQFLGEDGKEACVECKALKAACARGEQSDAEVRALTMTAMTAWLSRCAGGQGGIRLSAICSLRSVAIQPCATYTRSNMFQECRA